MGRTRLSDMLCVTHPLDSWGVAFEFKPVYVVVYGFRKRDLYPTVFRRRPSHESGQPRAAFRATIMLNSFLILSLSLLVADPFALIQGVAAACEVEAMSTASIVACRDQSMACCEAPAAAAGLSLTPVGSSCCAVVPVAPVRSDGTPPLTVQATGPAVPDRALYTRAIASADLLTDRRLSASSFHPFPRSSATLLPLLCVYRI